jgi:hypothetical protein
MRMHVYVCMQMRGRCDWLASVLAVRRASYLGGLVAWPSRGRDHGAVRLLLAQWLPRKWQPLPLLLLLRPVGSYAATSRPGV